MFFMVSSHHEWRFAIAPLIIHDEREREKWDADSFLKIEQYFPASCVRQAHERLHGISKPSSLPW